MKALRGVLVIGVCLAVVVAAQRHFGHATLPPHPPRGGNAAVVVQIAGTRSFANRIEAIGTAAANESVIITTTVAERVTRILFESGAEAKAGDLLVQLENAEEQAACTEAEINLKEQTREYERLKSLRDKKVIAEQIYDTQQSAMNAAAARLQAARARLQDRAVTAPFAGVLGIRQVSPGAMVSPGSTITTLDDVATIKADFAVPETVLAQLAIGQEVVAASAAWPGETFCGTVTSINTRVDPVTRAVAIQARLPNPGRHLRSGMLLTIELISHPHDALGIPEKALLSYADKQYVYVLPDGKSVVRREVRLGLRAAGWAEIAEGLQAGETIVVDGLMNLRDGMGVKVVPPPANTSADPAPRAGP